MTFRASFKTLLHVFTASAIALLLAACSEEGTGVQTTCLEGSDHERVVIEGGSFWMGSDDAYREESPAREVSVATFAIDIHEVTNRQFAAFIDATGYVTEAERLGPDGRDDPDNAGSAVFAVPTQSDPRWWRWRPGASWRAPEGPGSSIKGREDQPVVHVTLADAQAYADWQKADIPTAAEWEYAARGGLDAARYSWGDALYPAGEHKANIWQGLFPIQNSADDGFTAVAPVGCFDPNGYGLHDMIGNVWELTTDIAPDKRGPIIKGGSFLCAENYCQRYRPAAWQAQDQSLGTNHIGFRTIKRGQ